MPLYVVVGLSIQYSGLQYCEIICLLGQRMSCAFKKMLCNCLWMPICVTHIPVVGWSCRLIFPMLGIIIGSVWVSCATLMGLTISMQSHCCCILQCHHMLEGFMCCAQLVFPPPQFSLRIFDHLVSGVMMAVMVGIVYGWPTEPLFLRVLSNLCHWLLWRWFNQWTHPLMPLWLWCPLLGGPPFKYGFSTVVYTPVWLRIYAVSLDPFCTNIHPGVYRFLGLLPLHWHSYILPVRVWFQRVTAGT